MRIEKARLIEMFTENYELEKLVGTHIMIQWKPLINDENHKIREIAAKNVAGFLGKVIDMKSHMNIIACIGMI